MKYLMLLVLVQAEIYYIPCGNLVTNPAALNAGFIIAKQHYLVKSLFNKLIDFIIFFDNCQHDQRMFMFYASK
jgi:hypothetical protein